MICQWQRAWNLTSSILWAYVLQGWTWEETDLDSSSTGFPQQAPGYASSSSLVPLPSMKSHAKCQPLPVSLVFYWFKFTPVFPSPTGNWNSYRLLKTCILINELLKKYLTFLYETIYNYLSIVLICRDKWSVGMTAEVRNEFYNILRLL